jgi:hypothetical protein
MYCHASLPLSYSPAPTLYIIMHPYRPPTALHPRRASYCILTALLQPCTHVMHCHRYRPAALLPPSYSLHHPHASSRPLISWSSPSNCTAPASCIVSARLQPTPASCIHSALGPCIVILALSSLTVCLTATVLQPLSYSHCLTATVLQPLSYSHCLSTTDDGIYITRQIYTQTDEITSRTQRTLEWVS